MFNLFKKKEQSIALYAIAEGKIVSIEKVPDPMFAQRMLGDGVAFVFEGDCVFAPCDAQIIMITPTKHALGLKLANGAEVMIHIGLDTVNFQGNGFKLLVKEGQKVKRGQALVKLDRQFFVDNKCNLITPMIVTSQEYSISCMEKEDADLRTKAISFN